jgi:hypothetical protein
LVILLVTIIGVLQRSVATLHGYNSSMAVRTVALKATITE